MSDCDTGSYRPKTFHHVLDGVPGSQEPSYHCRLKPDFPYNRSRRYSREQNGATGAFLRFSYNRYYRYCRERHGFHIIATVAE